MIISYVAISIKIISQEELMKNVVFNFLKRLIFIQEWALLNLVN